MLRLVGGSAKGCRLSLPRSSDVRPATDRLRVSLFALLAPRLAGARVLDLFAGSGALGLEALSRGAAHSTFVENGAEALRTLSANIGAVGFPGRCLIVEYDLRHKLAIVERADLAFVDPPFSFFADTAGLEILRELLDDLTGRILTPGGLVVVRHEDKDEDRARSLLAAGGGTITLERSYGRSRIKVVAVPGDA